MMTKRFLVWSIVLCLLPSLAQSQMMMPDVEINAKFREFDFWVGEWEVFENGTDELVGHSSITAIVDGFGVMENYRSAQTTYSGISLNKYNPETDGWKQFWIDNSGHTLELTGSLTEDGKMVLTNDIITANGPEQNRIRWTPLPNGEIHQHWEVSKDDGVTWVTLFDGIYRRTQP